MYKSIARQISKDLKAYAEECNRMMVNNSHDQNALSPLLYSFVSDYLHGGHTTVHGTLCGYHFVISIDDNQHVVASVSDGPEWQNVGQVIYSVCTSAVSTELFAHSDFTASRQQCLDEVLATQSITLLGKDAVYTMEIPLHMMEWYTADSEVWQMESIPQTLPKSVGQLNLNMTNFC